MSLSWRDAGAALRSAGAVSFRTVDGVVAGDLKAVDQIRIRIADGTNPADLKEGYKQGIRLAASPTSAYGAAPPGTGPITTNSVVVGVAGGTPPYTHAWTHGAGITVNSPTSATTSFTGGASVDSTATDTVTDANGLTNAIIVPVSILRENPDA